MQLVFENPSYGPFYPGPPLGDISTYKLSREQLIKQAQLNVFPPLSLYMSLLAGPFPSWMPPKFFQFSQMSTHSLLCQVLSLVWLSRKCQSFCQFKILLTL